MASKLHKTGSIFARIDGLLKTGVTKADDRPMWYDIYKAFPPTTEPGLNIPQPDIKIKNIFYKEDIARAKLHKTFYKNRVWNLKKKQKDESLNTYLNKLEEGLTEDEAFEHIKSMLIAKAKSKTDADEVIDTVTPEAVEKAKEETAFDDNAKV